MLQESKGSLSPTGISSENIRQELPVDNPFSKLPIESKKIDDTAAALESKLQCEIDARREERFYWICAITIPLNVIFYKFMDSFFAFISLFLLQIIILIGLAGWLGVDHIAVLLERFFHSVSKRYEQRK